MTLYVTNLPGNSTPAELDYLFRQFGRVSDATVGADPAPGADPAGSCGTIRLDYGGWGAAVARLHGCEYRGRTLGVRAVAPWGRAGGY